MSYKNNVNKKVIIGISGGVDSAVAALLLKEQGYDVHAVFMQNWDDKNDPYCSATLDLSDARIVCDQIKIPLTTVNFADQYFKKVFQYMLDEYAEGRTPNPDIICNQEIKFKEFLNYAKNLGADYIATGHYARVDFQNDQWRLLKGTDNSKDQSYFLYTLGQNELATSLFPLGGLKKTEVRTIAKNYGLANYAKKDSTGICFIGERNFSKFLKEYLLPKPGEIATTDGKILGKHFGLMFYTLGQRQGLGVGGQKNQKELPWYVVAKNMETNQLIVAQEHEHPLLLSKVLHYSKANWIKGEPSFPLNCQAKIRYRQTDQECTITKINANKYRVDFAVAQWAITPGQAVVFYQENECLGGGQTEFACRF